jgi:hypothetical protein
VTVQFTVATAFSLVLLVAVANVLVDLYARGALHDALDEGVRAGVVAAARDGDPVAACEQRANEVMGELLRGPVGNDVRVSCEQRGDGWVRARANARFPSWLPGVPDWRVELNAAAREQRP